MRSMGSMAPLPEDAPSGTAVIVIDDFGKPRLTRTRSEPWQLRSGHVVVLLEGRAGGYDLGRCFVFDIEPGPDEPPISVAVDPPKGVGQVRVERPVLLQSPGELDAFLERLRVAAQVAWPAGWPAGAS